jgi:hypothetical protein
MDNRLNKKMEDEESEPITPVLSRLKNENPFAVPADYFESLNAEVMKKIEALPDFESVSSANPFHTPDGYFDSLPEHIRQKISDSKSKRIPLATWISETFSRPAPRIALAFASVAIIVAFSISYFTRTIHVDYSAEVVNDADQLNAAYLSQLDESVLTDVLAEETSVTANQDESLENYLLDNDIDLNSITDHL